MKRKLYLLSSLMLVMTMIWPRLATAQNNVSVWDGGAESWPQGQGQGTASSPYLIENARQLAYLAVMVNNGVNHYDNTYFRLTTDVFIDSNTVWQPIGLNATNYFGGHFDGNNHTVTIYLITSDMNYTGIFGYAKNGSFSNLTSAGQIKRTGSGDAYAGGICGYSTATFTNCHNTGNISSLSSSTSYTPYAGGICGYSTAPFTNCHNTGSVSSSYYAGGICGYSTATFPNCHNSGSVSSSNSSNRTTSSGSNSNYTYYYYYYRSYAGGICGYSTASYAFPNCYNTGNISSASASPYSGSSYTYYYARSYSGGICGYSTASYAFPDCYNTGNISSSRLSSSANFSSDSYAGGICGYNNSTISKCYNLGDISASESGSCYSGGICGYTSSIINCYNMGNIASKYNSGGICGYAGNTIKNCYNAGSLLSGTKGGISGNGGTVTNCYYLNTCGHAASTGGTAMTAAIMTSEALPVILNSDSVVFVIDNTTLNLNNGYPVFGSVSTQNADNVGATTATLHGSYQMRYAVDSHGFEYKKSSESSYTTVYATGSSPVSYNLSGLQGGTEYTYRFFVKKNGATNPYLGTDKTFTTAVCSLSVQISSNSTGLCEGDVITYTAVPSGGAGYQYTWSNGSHSNTINVSNNSTYTVTVTDNIGCQATASKQTTLYPAVTVSISGNTVLGSNGSTTLTASGANSYHWNTGSTTASITVSPTTNTTYTVTGTNQYGCTGTASVTVTVCQVPTVTTNTVSNIGTTSATCGGNVTSTGGANVTARGVCWSTSQNPTVSGSHTTNGNGTGSFTSSITGLTPNTTYYVKAYATNSAGTSYGAQKTFTTECNTVNVNIAGTTSINYGGSTTLTASGANSYSWSTGSSSASITVSPNANTTYTVTGTDSYGCTGTASVTVTVNSLKPTVTTNTVSNIGTTSATCGGNVTSTGGANVTARGVCWGTSQNPTVSNSHTTNGSGTGSFTSSITGLTPNTTYYVRAYATNSAGTSYGAQKTFTTSCNTVNVSIAGTTTINNGGSTTLTASGANNYSWSTGSSSASITVSPTTNTTYTVTGTNQYGCTGTASVTVTVNSLKPTVTTKSVTSITSTTASCGGNVTADGGATVTARGVCWSTSQNPTVSNSHTTNGSGTGSFTSSITGLSPNTTYYVRAYATNSAGTSYGAQKTFTTSCNTVNVSIAGATTINNGGSTTLTASGANSYSWSTGSGSASITVSPTATTIYTVTGTNQYGCTGTASVTVTVNNLAPTVKTNNVSGIAQTSATGGGNVTSSGTAAVTARGVCWSISHNPTIANAHTTDGSGTGTFTSSLTGLTPNTTYYVRAYATNSVGTTYGNEVSFTTISCSDITLPYSEDFESYTASTTAATGIEPTCWELVQEVVQTPTDKRPQLYYESSFAHSGNYSLKLSYQGVYAMPELSEDVPVNRVKLEMYLRQANTKYRLQAGIWEDNGTFVPVASFDNSTTNVEYVTCDFSSYTGNGRRIAFRNTLDNGSNAYASTNYLDDISLTLLCETISLPYTENFESFTTATTAATGIEPYCWELVQEDVQTPGDKRPQLYYESSFAHSGNYSLKLSFRGVYAMPELSEDVPVNRVKLEMYLRQANTNYQLQAGIWEDNGTFVPVASFDNTTTNVEFVTCDFSNYTGNGRRIAFRNTLDNGSTAYTSTNYLDDISLTLLCETISLPYTENFESITTSTTAATGIEPTCWELVQEDVQTPTDKRPQLYYESSFAHSGDYSLKLSFRGVYAMPKLSEDVPMNRVKLEMYLRQANTNYQLQAGIWEDNGNFVPVASFDNTTTNVEFVTCDFSSYTGNGRRIAFRNTLDNGSNAYASTNYLDDITLTLLCETISLPYTENFESITTSTTAATGIEPKCWELVQEDVQTPTDKRPQLYNESSYAHSGNYSLKLSFRGVYAMPELSEDVPVSRVKLEMYLRQANTNYRLQAGIWEDNGTFVPVASFDNTTTNVEFVTCDFSNYTGNGRRIAFRNTLDNGSNAYASTNYLDDISLTLLCEAISLPYTENFESITTSTTAATGIEPNCWELVKEDASMPDGKRPQLYFESSFAHSGNYSLKLSNRGVYAMPELSEEIPISHVKLEMYLRQANTRYQLEAGVWEDNGNFVPVATFDNATTDVVFVACDFSNYTGNGRRIAFRNVLGDGSNIAYSTNYLDDITLTSRCEAITLPYTETFESYTASTTAATGIEPDCWELVREDVAITDATRPQLYYKNSFAHSGNYSLLLNYRGVYAMPALSEEVPMSDVKLKMYVRQPNAAYRLEVGVWNGQTFELVQRINNSGTGVEFVECDFSSYTGSGRRIAFRNVLGGGANYNYSYNYIDDITLTFSSNVVVDEKSCPAAPIVTDHEGNVYATVQIGGQCWMRENLRTTKYADGTAISQGNSSSYTVGYWSYPNSDSANKQTYGLLYNWKAVMGEASSTDATPSGIQGVCPTGWHVPSEAEWTILMDYVGHQSEYVCGNDSSYIAKALASTIGWNNSSNSCAVGNDQSSNNATGFGAMLAGYGEGSNNSGFGNYAYFWSTTEQDDNYAYYRYLYYSNRGVGRSYHYKNRRYSVRCLRDVSLLHTVTTTEISYIGTTTATGGGNVTSNGGSAVTARGVCWSTSHNPTVNDPHTSDSYGNGSFNSSITGLTSNLTYFVRAYATNQYGTVYGNEVSFTTQINSNGDALSCAGTPTVTDIDGNVYNTVQIGGQCWMRENLRTTKYSDGTAITQGNYNSSTEGLWSYPNGDASYKQSYGLLYNWKAVMKDSTSTDATPSGVQGVCPTGWHVPSNAEWTILTDYVGSQSEYVCGNDSYSIAKALASTIGWYNYSSSSCAIGNDQSSNNATGFGARPAGCNNSDFGYYAYFWSTTEGNDIYAYYRYLYNSGNGMYRSYSNKYYRYSVRCLRDVSMLPTVTTKDINIIGTTTATGGGNVTSNGGSAVTARGVCWSTSPNPTVNDPHTSDSYGNGSFNSNIIGLASYLTYYVRAYATNQYGTVYGNEVSFTTPINSNGDALSCTSTPTVTDIDGNVYNTVQIGGQCWMRENLRTTKYSDGTTITQGNSSSNTVGYWSYPNGNASNKQSYGLLYNWKAVMKDATSSDATPSGVQGVCPTGWHVPSDAEWTILTDYVGSNSEYVCGSNSTTIAKALASTIGWYNDSYSCAVGNDQSSNNATGFGAMPAGYGQSSDNSNFGYYAYFWSTTELNDNYAYYRYLYYSNYDLYRSYSNKYYRRSVRCLRDEGITLTPPTVTTNSAFSVTSNTAYCGGNVVSEGGSTVTARGVCWSTSQSPNIGGSHTTDGSGSGSFISCITGLSPNTTYYVRAYAINSMDIAYGEIKSFTTPSSFVCGTSTIPDIDGNVYNTVQIGGQCWMRENLRTTKYADGTAISQGNNYYSTIGYWSYPNSDSANKQTYGLLYNWKAVMGEASSTDATPSGVQGVCPTGWHVPSDAEWSILTDYVGKQSEYVCGGNSTYIAKALASTFGWYNYSYSCVVGNDQSSNNATGFGAMPAGYGYNYDFGYGAFFWSTTERNENYAYLRYLYYSNNDLYRSNWDKYYQHSVRCLRDVSMLPTVTTKDISIFGTTTATGGGSVTSNGGSAVTARGVCWSTSHNPTVNDPHTNDNSGNGSFNSNITGLASNLTYYVRAYATNQYGTVYGNEVSFTTQINSNGDALSCAGTPTVTDIDGNVYNTVQIGGQCWMRENLRTTKYSDGTAITQGNYNSSTEGLWSYPNGDASYKKSYGLLYNWKAVMKDATSTDATPSGVQGICPTGWHVPSNAEWTILTDYVGSQSEYVCSGNSTNIAKALASTIGWYNYSSSCAVGNDQSSNNATGFGAMPAGYGQSSDNSSFGDYAYFWSTTELNDNSAYYRYLYYSNSGVGRLYYNKYYRRSVRCLRDVSMLPTVTTKDINIIGTTTATGGGNVTSNGGSAVTARGVCWSTSPNPTVNDPHTSDSYGNGSFNSNIIGLASNLTYYVRAYATNQYGTVYGNEVSFTTPINSNGDALSCAGTPTVTDIDDNVYNTVQIGGQCWMRENLRTTKYSDGTAITQGNYNSSTEGLWSYPNGDASYKKSYGLLYNWKAVMKDATSTDATPSGVQGICPTGWHVPSDAEWTILTDYVGSQSEFMCGNDSSYIAKALASTIGWYNSSSSCVVGNDQSSNNATGFGAMPAGYGQSSDNSNFGDYAYFWSTTELNDNYAYYRYVHSSSKSVSRSNYYKYRRYSVRCLRDNTNNKSDELNEDPNTAIPDDTSLEMADIDASLSVKEFTDASVNVTLYPNPTKDLVNVQCTMNNEQLEVKGIEVIDMYGKVIYTVTGANNDSPTQINVSNLAAGMYFVRVTTDEGVVTKAFVKR